MKDKLEELSLLLLRTGHFQCILLCMQAQVMILMHFAEGHYDQTISCFDSQDVQRLGVFWTKHGEVHGALQLTTCNKQSVRSHDLL